jgi:hypothetical protein
LESWTQPGWAKPSQHEHKQKLFRLRQMLDFQNPTKEVASRLRQMSTLKCIAVSSTPNDVFFFRSVRLAYAKCNFSGQGWAEPPLGCQIRADARRPKIQHSK